MQPSLPDLFCAFFAPSASKCFFQPTATRAILAAPPTFPFPAMGSPPLADQQLQASIDRLSSFRTHTTATNQTLLPRRPAALHAPSPRQTLRPQESAPSIYPRLLPPVSRKPPPMPQCLVPLGAPPGPVPFRPTTEPTFRSPGQSRAPASHATPPGRWLPGRTVG